MPGSGGDFDVGVRWLGADEDVLTDGLLDRLTSHVRSGRTVQSFADALFEKHGDQINLSGDNLRDKIVAYREPLDSDDELDSVPVELDDVVTETSLFILRPRIPEADARLLVMHARLHEETTRFDVLGLISAQRAGDSNSNCYELAIHLARKKDATRSLTELGAQDLDFFRRVGSYDHAREKSILNGSALAIVKDWLEVMEDVSSEQSYEPGLELLRLLFAAGAPESVLETVQFAVVVDDGDPIRIDDLDESLNLVKSESAPSKVTMVLIYDSPDADGAGSDRCLLMLCVGPKGSVARKFFEIDDALLETTQAELACRTIAGAQEGAPGLRAEDVLKGSVFRISAHYAKLREASERERFASDLADQFGISERLKGTTLTLANGTLREALQPLKSSRFIVCHVSCAAQTQADQDMAHHPHLAVAHLLFTYWLLKGDGLKLTMFGVPTAYQAARLDAEDDEDVARTLSFAILTELDFSDYDADSEASARRAIEELAYLWAGEVPKAVPHLEAAAAAGNALAATVVARLGERHPSQKLARKYDLTSFGAPFLELLPPGLQDLEQVISKYPVAQRKARGPDRAPEASRKEDAPREEEAPRSKAEVDKEIEEAMDKLEDVFVDAVAPAPASKKNAKKKAKKKAKAKEARKAAETSGPAPEIVRADANSDSDDSFKSALCDTPTAQSPVARPAEPPLLAPADDADSEDWVDVRARRGKGPRRVEVLPPPPPPPPRVPSPPPPPSPPSPAGAGGLLPALQRFVETHDVDGSACIELLDETEAIQRALLERLEALEATDGAVGDWSARVADVLEETRETEANERAFAAFAEESRGVDDPDEQRAAELQRRVKAFVDAQGVDGRCRKALEAYAVRDADACVRFLRAAPGELGEVKDRNAYVEKAVREKHLLAASASELNALTPELRSVADALALTSDVAKVLKKLSLAQQRRAAERLADPGVMFGVLLRNAFVLAELKKKEGGRLLRDDLGNGRVNVDLVAAVDGIRLSKDCYHLLRDLNRKKQALCALALASADFSELADLSGYIEKGLEKGTLLRKGHNCSLDAIVAVLHRCATFRGAFRDPRALVGVAKDRRQDHLRVVDALDAALSAGDAGDVDAAIDGLRVALGAVEGGRGDLSTKRRALDAAEVFEALLEAPRVQGHARGRGRAGVPRVGPDQRLALRGLQGQGDDDAPRLRGPRAATALTLADAARRGDSLEAAFRDAHAACAKSCDHCKAPGSIDVLVSIHDTRKALALSVAWFTSTPEPADVEGVLRLAHKPLDGAAVFRPPKPGAKRLGLFAVVVFQDAHYTALVRDERADSWTWHDRRDVTLVGSFESVVAKCRNDGGAPLCPYLLFFDA
ncbi:hypothetical protein JL721_4815 [Aureococcus anophagefferens]|nr:hypothetical protein JL721_4815 [Aureococcus anophagefferens]